MTGFFDTHMHTPLCKHAVGEPEEYAAAAQRRGLAGIIITCHNPLPDGQASASRMDEWQFENYLNLVERARVACRQTVEVRLGIECDYWPGLEDYLQKQIRSAPFEYVLGSVHPHLADYRKRFWTGDPVTYQKQYFEHLAQAAESRLFDTLAHPDLVKNVFSADWDLPRIFDHVLSCLDRIAKTGVALELNTSGRNKAVPEFNPGPDILRAARERGIPIVIGSDAHEPDRVADRFEEALGALRAAGYVNVSLHQKRRHLELDIQHALAALHPQTPAPGTCRV